MDRPILFSAPMVRAILEGRKTVTRRIVRVHDTRDDFVRLGGFYAAHDDMSLWTFNPAWDDRLDGKGDPRPSYALRCPYGQPGDLLWVRETFRPSASDPTCIHYAASVSEYERKEKGPWKPSIFMRRSESRITLEVTSVRVERLQDISEADAVAEGVDFAGHTDEIMHDYSPDERFSMLWESINGAGSWNENPWVWVVEFRRVEA